MSDNQKKDLIVKKENIFDKITNFIRSLFSKKQEKVQEKKKEKLASAEKMLSDEFNKSLKVNSKSELSKTEILQYKYENDQLDLNSLSDKDLRMLNALYQRQVYELQKVLARKMSDLEELKLSYSNN